MNKEIKEILYVLKQIVIGRASRLTCREADKLLDYITNLQEIEKDHQRINGELRQQLSVTEELAMEYKARNEKQEENIDHLIKENQKQREYIKYLENKTPIESKIFYGDSREELQSRIDKALDFRSSDKEC